MALSEKQLKDLVLVGGFVTARQFSDALDFAKKKRVSPAEALVELDLMRDENLGRLIAESQGFRFVRLGDHKILRETLSIIPEIVARKQEIIAFDRTKEGLKVATPRVDDYEIVNWLSKKTGDEVSVFYATSLDVKEALKYYRKSLEEEFNTILKKYLKAAKIQRGVQEDETPIIRMTDALLTYAYENRASDIHIEPRERSVVVRYRIDGILHEVITFPKNVHERIVSRIKVLSRLRTDEHMAAQASNLIFAFPSSRSPRERRL